MYKPRSSIDFAKSTVHFFRLKDEQERVLAMMACGIARAYNKGNHAMEKYMDRGEMHIAMLYGHNKDEAVWIKRRGDYRRLFNRLPKVVSTDRKARTLWAKGEYHSYPMHQSEKRYAKKVCKMPW